MDNSLISVMKKWWCFQGGKGIFSEYFGTERVAENYTKLGTYIKRQQQTQELDSVSNNPLRTES